MELTERVAYLKGLIEGLGVDDSSKEGKVILTITDILEDIVLSISDLEDGVELIADQMESIDEDLGDLYDDLYSDDDDDDDDFDEEGDLYEVTCPSCGDIICVDEEMLDEGEMGCPGCGETLEFDFGGTLEECGCMHDHDDEHKSHKHE